MNLVNFSGRLWRLPAGLWYHSCASARFEGWFRSILRFSINETGFYYRLLPTLSPTMVQPVATWVSLLTFLFRNQFVSYPIMCFILVGVFVLRIIHRGLLPWCRSNSFPTRSIMFSFRINVTVGSLFLNLRIEPFGYIISFSLNRGHLRGSYHTG